MQMKDEEKMLTVTEAAWAHGYSNCDHLLEDGGMAEAIGCEFRTLTAAATAAAKAAGEQDRRCSMSPLRISYVIEGFQHQNIIIWP